MFERYKAYLKDNPHGLWFKRRLFGWGWTPATWQGWLCIIFFLVCLCVNAAWLESISAPTLSSVLMFVGITIVLVAVLIGVCYWKGESPRWQWGYPDKKKEPINQHQERDK